MVVILTGVAGAGKTTVGRELAQALGSEFFEGDDFHSLANREKLHAGIPLSDADREPWLAALSDLIDDVLRGSADAVLACSALRQSYRDFLARDSVVFVYLCVPFEVASERLQKRVGHFFNPLLLASQFATLEQPHDGLAVDATRPVARIVEQIERSLRRSGA